MCGAFDVGEVVQVNFVEGLSDECKCDVLLALTPVRFSAKEVSLPLPHTHADHLQAALADAKPLTRNPKSQIRNPKSRSPVRGCVAHSRALLCVRFSVDVYVVVCDYILMCTLLR